MRAELNQNLYLQKYAPIHPGNSGGRLFSIRMENGNPVAELVGINDWGYRGRNTTGDSTSRIDYIKKILENWGIQLSK